MGSALWAVGPTASVRTPSGRSQRVQAAVWTSPSRLWPAPGCVREEVVWLEMSCRNALWGGDRPSRWETTGQACSYSEMWRDEDLSQSRGSRDGEKKDVEEQKAKGTAWPARGSERRAEVKRGVTTWESRCKKCFERRDVRPQARASPARPPAK